jgi:hypothetical protein
MVSVSRKLKYRSQPAQARAVAGHAVGRTLGRDQLAGHPRQAGRNRKRKPGAIDVPLIGNNNKFFRPETGIEPAAQGIQVYVDNLRVKFLKAPVSPFTQSGRLSDKT